MANGMNEMFMVKIIEVQLRSVINIPLRYSEINKQLFLFLNNRHWQEMDKCGNFLIDILLSMCVTILCI